MYYDFNKGEIIEKEPVDGPMVTIHLDKVVKQQLDDTLERIAADEIMEQTFGPHWREIIGSAEITPSTRKKHERK
jgi:hypothetical protein